MDPNNNPLPQTEGNEGQIIGSSEGDDHHPMDIDNPDHDSIREVEDYASIHRAIISKRKRNKSKPILIWEVLEEENKRWLASHEDADIDLENLNDVIAETAEPPPDLIMPLLRYQKEWLAWALQQEESAARGGILADEMGLGKTVQAIALVLAKRAYHPAVDGVLFPPSSSSGLPELKATLVVCPSVAVIQWVNEIDRSTLKGSNKVLVYHGAKRGRTLHEFSNYDFVITTYSIVQAEFRKHVMPSKKECFWCGQLFNARKLFLHQECCRLLNGGRTYKPMKGGNKETPNKGKCHNKNKAFGAGTSTNDLDGGAEEGLGERNSNLHSIKWNRIILDEAHYIKDRHGYTTKAILSLESSYKWALSGTPIQNRVGELYTLIRFLQIGPYSNYFCRDCDCTELDPSFESEYCLHCTHANTRHFCWWNKYIATPIKSQGHTGSRRGAMILLKHKILKGILLRRTKKGRCDDLALPPKTIFLRRESLDIKEEDYYTSLYNESQAQFNTYVTEGTVMNNYGNIFGLLTRLRQALDHPYLVIYSKSRNNNEVLCGLCHELAEDPLVSACKHSFCSYCWDLFSTSAGQVLCPTCKKPLTIDLGTEEEQEDKDTKTTIKGFKPSSIINRIRLDDFQTSTKIDALREEIRFMFERDGSAKGIVFSQFTSFLDLIRYTLQKSGIQCVQLDGSMSMKARDTAIKKFNEDPNCRLFLMSLKAGGVALNLTVASHVFMMDPWSNPAIEQQAQDRVHRIGQYKPIRVVKFVIEDTIEERILKLQERNESVYKGTSVGGAGEDVGRLTEADIRFLLVI